MQRRSALILAGAAALSACAPTGGAQLGADGRPLPQLYRIDSGMTDQIYFRLLDSVNSLRAARGLGQMQFSAKLNAAAATHSRDMSVQNRPWHFGSDGSSPLTRVQRLSYEGRLGGELISETYQTEVETLAAWMAQADTRAVVLDPAANEIGFSWWQEPNGKIWWTLVTGTAGAAPFRGVTPAAQASLPTQTPFTN